MKPVDAVRKSMERCTDGKLHWERICIFISQIDHIMPHVITSINR